MEEGGEHGFTTWEDRRFGWQSKYGILLFHIVSPTHIMPKHRPHNDPATNPYTTPHNPLYHYRPALSTSITSLAPPPLPQSPQPIRPLRHIPPFHAALLPPNPLILNHPSIPPNILPLKLHKRPRHLRLDDEMVVAVRAVLVALVPLLRVLAEALLALLAREHHLEALQEGVRFRLGVAGYAVVPFLAAGRAEGDLCV